MPGGQNEHGYEPELSIVLSSRGGALRSAVGAEGEASSRTDVLLIGTKNTETAIQRALASGGRMAGIAPNITSALEAVSAQAVHVLVIGPDLPGPEGCDFCSQARALVRGHRLAILFLSERTALADKLAAFNAGADDYVTLPCYMPELALRIQALLRRSCKEEEPVVTRHTGRARYDLRLDRYTGQLRYGSRVVSLTPVETRIIDCLLMHIGQPVSTAELIAAVWGSATGGPDAQLLRVHVRNLRAKLEADPNHPAVLKTIARLGYCLRRTEE
jgi:DNA-binding response OmpR family regulator